MQFCNKCCRYVLACRLILVFTRLDKNFQSTHESDLRSGFSVASLMRALSSRNVLEISGLKFRPSSFTTSARFFFINEMKYQNNQLLIKTISHARFEYKSHVARILIWGWKRNSCHESKTLVLSRRVIRINIPTRLCVIVHSMPRSKLNLQTSIISTKRQ